MTDSIARPRSKSVYRKAFPLHTPFSLSELHGSVIGLRPKDDNFSKRRSSRCADDS